jgi:hypothetical protein
VNEEDHHMKLNALMKGVAIVWIALLGCSPVGWSQDSAATPNQVLDWNQIFIDSLSATNTAGAVSDRLAAIVHTAIFDAYNGIERRYTPIFVHDEAPIGASRRAAVIAAAHAALLSLFPSRQQVLDDAYATSLAALSDDGEDGGQLRDQGIAWGTFVAQSVLAWRATDGFGLSYPAFRGGTAKGQWRPTPPACASMSAQQLAFTSMFVLDSNTQFRPAPPRPLTSPIYTFDFNIVKAFGRNNGSMRTPDQTAIALFWDGSPSIHWNQAANQMARANQLSISDSSRLLAVLNIAMADTRFTTWSAKRFYGDVSYEVTWRPITAITLADPCNPGTIPDPASLPGTISDPAWLPLIVTPAHPEYPAGHPSANGAGATVVLNYFAGLRQTFTVTTPGQPDRTYHSIVQARLDGDSARVYGGLHYPSTVAISDAEGAAIANYVNRNFMQRLNGQ